MSLGGFCLEKPVGEVEVAFVAIYLGEDQPRGPSGKGVETLVPGVQVCMVMHNRQISPIEVAESLQYSWCMNIEVPGCMPGSKLC